MDRVLFGDNQFFAVNHASDEKARAQAMRFAKDEAIMRVLDDAIDCGINTFMCTTHDRISKICQTMRNDPERYGNFNFYPCMPYAHKYANAVTDFGIFGAIREYVPGNFITTVFKGGAGMLSKNYIKLMELLVDAEMKMFSGLNTPVIFLQNVVVDLILGLRMPSIFKAYDNYIRTAYHAEPGYITMNMPALTDALESVGVSNPIICCSINKAGFRMSGCVQTYEKYLLEKKIRVIAMQVMSAGTIEPQEAIEYLENFPQIQSVLFGASSKGHIMETKKLIDGLFHDQ